MKKINESKERRSPSDLKMAFFDSIHLIPPCWNELVHQQSIYLTTDYLSAIEDVMSKSISFRYILFSKGAEPVGVAAYQLICIDSDSLDLDKENKRGLLATKILDRINLTCLINGTLFGSGEHGFYYSTDITDEEAFKALADGTKRLCALEQTRNKIHVIMVKEYFPENTLASNHLTTYKYRGFNMEPNMVLHLKSEWKNMDDYFASMTSKYRSRAKSNLKKSSLINEKDLTAFEIRKYQPELIKLFDAVHSKAKYKLGTLDTSAFVNLKENLKADFMIKGYFLEDRLVGFSSVFINHGSLDANYVGLNYEYNKSHGIYQRILYDLVKAGLSKGVSKIHFGRTAGEIKSNLGAKAVDMKCYVRTKNSVSNKVIKPLVKRVSTPSFVVRNPFKEY